MKGVPACQYFITKPHTPLLFKNFMLKLMKTNNIIKIFTDISLNNGK